MIYPNFTFAVGENEKHDIYFEIDPINGISVFVDGEPSFIQGRETNSIPFSLEVGSEEKHTITFQVAISENFPMLSQKRVQVSIDGKIFKTF